MTASLRAEAHLYANDGRTCPERRNPDIHGTEGTHLDPSAPAGRVLLTPGLLDRPSRRLDDRRWAQVSGLASDSVSDTNTLMAASGSRSWQIRYVSYQRYLAGSGCLGANRGQASQSDPSR
jgi:hypothetical protein